LDSSDADHIQVVKPEGPEDRSYIAFRKAFSDTFPQVTKRGTNGGSRSPVPAIQLPTDIDPLCRVDKRLAKEVKSDKTARFTSLLDYYRDANAGLFRELEQVAEELRQGRAHTGATYVLGAAGVGKSFVRRALKSISPDAQCPIELSRLFRNDSGAKAASAITTFPDLQTSDGQVFNELPGLRDPDRFAVDDLKTLARLAKCKSSDRSPPVILLDDLDEIDPQSAGSILRSIDELVSHQVPAQTSFLHVIVFGRPEGFWEWFRDTHRVPPRNLSMFNLDGPTYDALGDLEFIANESLAFHRSSQLADANVKTYVRFVRDNPFLTYSIGNLQLSNLLMEQAILNPSHSAHSLRAYLYDDLIDRNKDSHGRPSSKATEYGRLLEEVAAKYAGVVDEAGFFSVKAEDVVRLEEDGHSYEVRVRNVLNRSGVAFLRPADFRTTRYRFEPFWVHPHLVERRNARLVPGHQYRVCQ
jgi:hypothetical protein